MSRNREIQSPISAIDIGDLLREDGHIITPIKFFFQLPITVVRKSSNGSCPAHWALVAANCIEPLCVGRWRRFLIPEI